MQNKIDLEMMSVDNPILNTDSYKHSHYKMYPPNATRLYSYVESRNGGIFPKCLYFGIKKFYTDMNNAYVTYSDIAEAKEFLQAHGVHFNANRWKRVVEKHDGHIPVKIKTLPEGHVVNAGIPLVTIEDTDDELIGMGSHLETHLLRTIWYLSTVATISYWCKQKIRKFFDISSDSDVVDFSLHDFGARGVSSFESSGLGGMAHLINFKGTDNLTGILYANHYYNSGICGFSINAAEHSTVTAWGKDGEANFISNLIDQFGKPGQMVAAPCDSFDIYYMVNTIIGEKMKQKIIDSGCTLVVRPDSGSPIWVPLNCIQILGEKFGYTINSKGYRVLHPSVRVIQGDGVTINSIDDIYRNIVQNGWAADNLVLGMGGGLLQHVNRDTLNFGMKASSILIDGNWVPINKSPVTDSGKASKKGKFIVFKNSHGFWDYMNEPSNSSCLVPENALQPIETVCDVDFNTIREIANSYKEEV